jgi:hypothetical protein
MNRVILRERVNKHAINLAQEGFLGFLPSSGRPVSPFLNFTKGFIFVAGRPVLLSLKYNVKRVKVMK